MEFREGQTSMKLIEIALPARISHPLEDQPAQIPVAIPELMEILQFAKEKHRDRQTWRGYAYGWPAAYCVEGNLPAGFLLG